MLDSPCSSRGRTGSVVEPAGWVRIAILASLLLGTWGCATVRPEDKEYLAEPSMTFTAGGMGERHVEHVLNNREGSFGGGSTKGGGCGCN